MISRYILRSVSFMFFPFFFVLFFIFSILLLINIATITTNIKISLLDLLTLFYYGTPGGLFFVIAITFFSACVLGTNKLSYDSEMLVFFSLGISPKKIVLVFLPLCIIVSIVLLMFSFIMTPLSKSAYKDFLNHKSSTVDVNITPGNVGQQIGDWLLYIDAKQENVYKGLVLYSTKGDNGQNFIIANAGEAKNENGYLALNLQDGSAYFDTTKNNNKQDSNISQKNAQNDNINNASKNAINEKSNTKSNTTDSYGIQKISFQNMIVRSFLSAVDVKDYNIINYWALAFKGDKTQQRRFSQALVTSLFPIASIFFIPFFGIRNPRFHKNHVYLHVFSSVGCYFLIMYGASVDFPFAGLALPFIWFFLGFYLYKKYISKIY